MCDAPELISQIEILGLRIFGRFEISAEDCPEGQGGLSKRSAILIGNVGPAMWRVFENSKEYQDGKRDPLNRWTAGVVGELATKSECHALFPFDQPYWPFQRFAHQATGEIQSPLGIFIHPEYGLWHAFRAVLIFERGSSLGSEVHKLIQVPEKLIHPCDDCVEKPCLSACPVNAFSDSRLDVQSCFSHIDSTVEPHCMQLGCRARDACPVGKKYRYSDEQVRFHMNYYRN